MSCYVAHLSKCSLIFFEKKKLIVVKTKETILRLLTSIGSRLSFLLNTIGYPLSKSSCIKSSRVVTVKRQPSMVVFEANIFNSFFFLFFPSFFPLFVSFFLLFLSSFLPRLLKKDRLLHLNPLRNPLRQRFPRCSFFWMRFVVSLLFFSFLPLK